MNWKHLLCLISLLALSVTACTDQSPSTSAPQVLDTRAARNTGGIVVSSTNPDSATRDQTLDVVINGSGFVSGAAASWALAGVEDPDQVRTNSTRYVNSRQLVANITISATATVGDWDVIVRAGSKGGIGTETFTIRVNGSTDTDPRAQIVWDSEVNVSAPGSPELFAPAGIQGDARDKFGRPAGFSEYQGDYCGVHAKIFWDDLRFSGSGDLVFDADKENGNLNGCGAARKLRFHLFYQPGGAPGASTALGTFSNVNGAMMMAPGEVRQQRIRFWYVGLRDCDRIEFDAPVWPTSSNIRVTRLPGVNSARRWKVESVYPHMAMCTAPKGSTYYAKSLKYLPFAFTATEIRFPYPTFP